MPEPEKKKSGRLQKRREKKQMERERTGDTPEAAAERSKPGKNEYDPTHLKQLGARTGIFQ